jgi:hypothetical protein
VKEEGEAVGGKDVTGSSWRSIFKGVSVEMTVEGASKRTLLLD